MRRALRRVGLAAWLAAWSGAALAQTEVSIPSADLSRGPGLMLKAFWFEAPVSSPAPPVRTLTRPSPNSASS